jgi:heat shock protein HslJ
MRVVTFLSAGVLIFTSAFIMKKTKSPSQSLYEHKWTLTKIHSEAGIETVTANAFIQFNEEKKSGGGKGGCNNFGSSITVNGNTISFRNIFSTKMYCEGIQQTENIFFKQLGVVNRFEIKGKLLLLFHDKELLLELEAA